MSELPVDPNLQQKDSDMITVSKKDLEKYKQDIENEMASKVLVNTLQILKMFNQINDSLVNMTAFVANMRELVFKDLSLPEKNPPTPQS